MKIYPVSCWDDFEIQLRELEKILYEQKGEFPPLSSKYLFRGQGNASWSLETTLDRFSSERPSLFDYYQYAFRASYRIVAFTGTKWNIPSVSEYKNWLDNHDSLNFSDFEPYEYYAYLRHHGFPSPLLDWTQSPYVAAFFAFRDMPKYAKEVAIFVYQEHPGVGKISSSNRPVIHRLGPYIGAHKRHFLQQSQYTFCTEIVDGELHYAEHQGVLGRDNQQQDFFWKFIIPASQRRSFLTQLNRMNINAFSLFGSEDSLIEAIVDADPGINL